ncbi:MAG: hypothetical protein EHM57_03930 [Actinobacteria bacterium]|nr:MAG: hypothetical protein EHM57_03930 [Actinomycetota bacterium]
MAVICVGQSTSGGLLSLRRSPCHERLVDLVSNLNHGEDLRLYQLWASCSTVDAKGARRVAEQSAPIRWGGGAMTELSDTGRESATSPEYELARKRVEKKRKYRGDLVAYVVINAFLIGVWAASGFGYFWPGWVLAGWGVLLLLEGWNLYYRQPISDDDIVRELDREP